VTIFVTLERGVSEGELVSIDLNELTDKQKAFAQEYVRNGGDAAKAAKSAGYSAGNNGRIGFDLIRLPHVHALIRYEQARLLNGRLASVALATLESLMQDKDVSGAVRLDAAKTVLDRAGHISKAQARPESTGPKALTDMTVDELDAFIAAGAKAVDKARDAAAIQGSATVVSAQDDAQPIDITPQ
jgi:phage terminase small subunit